MPAGSVTPLAVLNPEAAHVSLLLDAKINSQEVVYVHPLVNTVSIGLSPGGLAAALAAAGRAAPFVDLEVEPKIDADNLPDLKQYIPETQGPDAAAVGAAGGAGSAASSGAAPPAVSPSAAAAVKSSGKGTGGSKDVKSGGAAAAEAASYRVLAAASDVASATDEVIQQVAVALLGKPAAEAGLDAYKLVRLRADVNMRLSSVKNAAYALGYNAGKGSVVAIAEKRFS